ncbi:MAG TPA: HD domain-containing protein [Saprospiraceae bacterium]|nr:HD domain-containing protein [Saprospiraceae bacterium]HMQ84456.1 HD domain-containing protein [Saprospiraceae bacterium]
MELTKTDISCLEKNLKPETDLEQALLNDPDFKVGLFWGLPRYGHPEGEVHKHIKEVLDNIDQLDIDANTREKLRLVAFVHDTFKYVEEKTIPRDWTRHHGVFARQFLQKYVSDESLLNLVEYHDEAYYIWRLIHLYHKPMEGGERLEHLLNLLGDDLMLYFLFFKCDTQTGDKNQAPLKWFDKIVQEVLP